MIKTIENEKSIFVIMKFIENLFKELGRKFYYIMMRDEDMTTFILLVALLMTVLSIMFLEIAHFVLFIVGASTIILSQRDI